MAARTPQGPAGVTARQREVARLVAEGQTNPQIAETLGITLDGAKHHVSELLARLNLSRREQIAAWYRKEAKLRRLPLATPVLLIGGAAAAVAVAVAIAAGVAVLRDGTTVETVAPPTSTPIVDRRPSGIELPVDTFQITLVDLRQMNLGASDLTQLLPALSAGAAAASSAGVVDASPIESGRARMVPDTPAGPDAAGAGVYTIVEPPEDAQTPISIVSSRVVLYRSSAHALGEFFDLLHAGEQVTAPFEVVDPPGAPASGVWDDAVRIIEHPGSTIVLIRVGPALGTITVVRNDHEPTAVEATTLARALAQRMRDVLTARGAFED